MGLLHSIDKVVDLDRMRMTRADVDKCDAFVAFIKLCCHKCISSKKIVMGQNVYFAETCNPHF